MTKFFQLIYPLVAAGTGLKNGGKLLRVIITSHF
jgi:hypothetical protein